MRYVRGTKVAALAVLLAACTDDEQPTGFVSSEVEAYCAIASRPDLVSWVGNVVTFCEQGEIDHHGACTVGRVRGSEVQTLELGDLRPQLALPASRGRLVVLLDDDRLVLTDGGANIERELDRWAAGPSISADGERIAWIGIPDGYPIADVGFGTPKVVAVMSLSEGNRTVLVEDNMASAPRPLPMSREVLYVSINENGVSGFFLAGPSRGATQITNAGLVEDNEEVDPVAGGVGVFAGNGALFYSVTGLESAEEVIDDPDADPPLEDDEENGEVVDDVELDIGHLFRLVVADDEARVEDLGEGAWPHLTSDGSVLAALPNGSTPCATIYTLEGTP
jgi:hypothetical protein